MTTVESFSSVSAFIVSFSRIWIQVRNRGWKDNLWERQCLLLPFLLLSAQAFITFLLPNPTEQVNSWKMHPQVSPLQSFIAAPRHFSGQIWDACYLPTGKVRLRKVKKCAYRYTILEPRFFQAPKPFLGASTYIHRDRINYLPASQVWDKSISIIPWIYCWPKCSFILVNSILSTTKLSQPKAILYKIHS